MKNPIQIEKIKSFYYVYETKNFSAAAKKLGITQSTVSKNISNLERELGCKLFERRNNKVNLTPRGDELVGYIIKVFMHYKDLEEYLNWSSSNPKEITLKIVGGESTLASLVINKTNNFCKNHPNTRLQYISINKISPFSISELRVGILGYLPDDHTLIQKYLMTFHLGLFASKGYLEKYGTPKSMGDLDDHRLITFDNEHVPFTSFDNWFLTQETKDSRPRKPYLIINTVPLTAYAAQEGLGIVTLQRESPFVKQAGLIEVLPNIEAPQFKVYYSYLKAHEGNKTILSFEDHLRENIARLGWK